MSTGGENKNRNGGNGSRGKLEKLSSSSSTASVGKKPITGIEKKVGTPTHRRGLSKNYSSSSVVATSSVTISSDNIAVGGGNDSTSSVTSLTSATEDSGYYEGTLLKWVNYVKLYRERFFILNKGILSYYRSREEIGTTCRGSIALAGATISFTDRRHISVSTSAQNWHLTAMTEADRQKWLLALKLSKDRLMEKSNIAASDDNSDSEEEPIESLDSHHNVIDEHIKEIHAHAEVIYKQTDEMKRRFVAFETADTLAQFPVLSGTADIIGGFHMTVEGLTKSCRNLQTALASDDDRWRRALLHEKQRRSLVEETLHTLAKQHNVLERRVSNCKGGSVMPGRSEVSASVQGRNCNDFEDDDDDAEILDDADFFDCLEELEAQDEAAMFQNGSGGKFDEINDKNGISSAAAVVASTAANVVSLKENSPTFAVPFTPGCPRRLQVKYKLNKKVSLWGVMKNCIGKDLSKIPMPVFFNEPTSFLQRLCEDMEYSSLLDRAILCESSTERMAYVAAFTASSYASTAIRTGKPFNPLLGETFECDRREDFGWRYFAEQVSHHPPICAMHAEGNGWTFWQEFSMTSKFRGKYLQIVPTGISHLTFAATGDHYTWRKVGTTIHNIIVGKLWIDQHGEMEIINHTHNEKCFLKYNAYGYFSSEPPRKVHGTIVDSKEKVHYNIVGRWDEYMSAEHVSKDSSRSLGEIWRRSPMPPDHERMYGFSYLAIQLNEMENGIAASDSRLRTDQRMMENGLWDEATKEKQRLEEKQRTARRSREASKTTWSPRWFSVRHDAVTQDSLHTYNGGYWEAKDSNSFTNIPDIF